MYVAYLELERHKDGSKLTISQTQRVQQSDWRLNGNLLLRTVHLNEIVRSCTPTLGTGRGAGLAKSFMR